MLHSYVCHDLFICVSRLFSCYIIHVSACHDSFIYVTWAVQLCDVRDMSPLPVWQDTFMRVTWGIYVWSTPYSRVSHTRVTRPIRMCDMNHFYVWLLLHVCDMFPSHVFHNPQLSHTATHCNTLQHAATQLVGQNGSSASLGLNVDMRDVTPLYVPHDSHCNKLQNTATRCNTAH